MPPTTRYSISAAVNASRKRRRTSNSCSTCLSYASTEGTVLIMAASGQLASLFSRCGREDSRSQLRVPLRTRASSQCGFPSTRAGTRFARNAGPRSAEFTVPSRVPAPPSRRAIALFVLAQPLLNVMDLLLHLLVRHVGALGPFALARDPARAGLDQSGLPVQAGFDAV